MKVLPQIRLRTFFLIFVCAAVGLTCATAPPRVPDPSFKALGLYIAHLNYHYALLTAAAMAIVIGLFEQVMALRRWLPPFGADDGGFRFGRSFAITWRISLLILIVVCLLGTVLLSRQVLSLPKHGEFTPYQVFPDKILVLAIIVVLVDSLRRWRHTDRRRQSLWTDVLVFILGASLALFYIWPDSGMIVFLVHIATQGIESAQRYHRPGVFPNHELEHFRTYWMSLAAVIAVLLAAVLLVRGRSARLSNAKLFTFTFLYTSLVGGAAVFCLWFYRLEFPRVSPDMASVGFASTWFDWVSCGVVLAILVTAAAYRLAVDHSDEATWNVPSVRPDERFALHESALFLLLLFGAAVLYCVDGMRGIPSIFRAPKVYEYLGYFFRSPDSYLMIAIAVLSHQLCWVRWKRRNDTLAWNLRAVDRRRFVWNWLAVALLAVVGVPTIAIYCFASWLGPWQLYGP